jgi:predicted DNA-binding transcriptional regulator YafY
MQLLPRRRPGWTTTALRVRLKDRGFAVHLRTVQRDLDRLSSRFGFTCDDHSPPRWFWPPGAADLSLPAQDPFSALTWSLIAQHLEPLLPRSLLREVEGQFVAARTVLQSGGATQLKRWQQRVRSVPRGLPLQAPEIEPTVLDAVYAALLEGHQLHVDYQARNSTDSKPLRLQPLGLVFRDHCGYLVATANDYTDVVQFALHRMKAAEVQTAAVVEPPQFSLDAYIDGGGFLYTQGDPLQIKLVFDAYTAQHLLESPIADDQQSQVLTDGRIELTATVSDSQQLTWWLLGFGDKVEVIAPAAVRRRIAAHANTLSQRYAE